MEAQLPVSCRWGVGCLVLLIFAAWLENSMIYSCAATGLTLVTTIPAGYGLAIGRFPGRNLALTGTTVAMVMPATALALPTFLELNAVHLLGHALCRGALRILPVRCVPGLPLLRDGSTGRPARRSAHRRLQRVAGVPSRRPSHSRGP